MKWLMHPRQGSLQEESPSFGEAERMGDEKDVVPPPFVPGLVVQLRTSNRKDNLP